MEKTVLKIKQGNMDRSNIVLDTVTFTPDCVALTIRGRSSTTVARSRQFTIIFFKQTANIIAAPLVMLYFLLMSVGAVVIIKGFCFVFRPR